MNALEQLIIATGWKITEPPAYGLFHISFTLIGFAFSAWLAWKLRGLGEKGNNRLLLICGGYLAVAEVYKQLLYWFVIQPGEYAWWIFPFQMCSVPMYLCMIVPFLRPGKLRSAMYSFMMLYNLLGGAISFAEPSGLLHPYLTLTAHSMVWHMMLVFVGLYIAFSGRGGHEKQDYIASTKVFLVCCCIAFAINLCFWEVSDGSINMFFIGPKDNSLIVFKQISQALGWYVGTAIYIPAVCLGAYLVYLPIRMLYQKKGC